MKMTTISNGKVKLKGGTSEWVKKVKLSIHFAAFLKLELVHAHQDFL